MAKHFLFNDTDAPKLMGGKLVPPGEGREVEDAHLPTGELPSGEALLVEEKAPDLSAERLKNLMDLLANPLATVVPALAEHSDDTLAELARLEGEHDTPRVTLLNAIAALQLKRAQAQAGGEPT
jgi:hypothetical protein